MAQYVDGFVLPIAKKNVGVYRKMSRKAGKIWREHGALEYRECIGQDLAINGVMPFTKMTGARAGETVIFSWVVYKSRAHRDKVTAKVMADPRLQSMMEAESMPIDLKRMAYGGFEVIVAA